MLCQPTPESQVPAKAIARPTTAVEESAEQKRLAELRAYNVLGTMPEQAFDDLAILAAAVCRTPIAAITLMEEHRFWMKSRIGTPMQECSRHGVFCAFTVLQPDSVFEVPDANTDVRFETRPVFSGNDQIRFYAGVALINPKGFVLGTICVMDKEPRRLTDVERRALKALARQVMALLELRRANADLELQGLTDPLTQIRNRRAFDRRLTAEWNEHIRLGKSLSLAIVDIDNFKSINDRFGHAAGDGVLVMAAKIPATTTRETDFVARIGGEEFAIIMPQTESGVAMLIAQAVRRAFDEGIFGDPVSHVTASIGVASTYPQADSDPYGLVAAADEALYDAKRHGRNCVIFFDGWRREDV